MDEVSASVASKLTSGSGGGEPKRARRYVRRTCVNPESRTDERTLATMRRCARRGRRDAATRGFKAHDKCWLVREQRNKQRMGSASERDHTRQKTRDKKESNRARPQTWSEPPDLLRIGVELRVVVPRVVEHQRDLGVGARHAQLRKAKPFPG